MTWLCRCRWACSMCRRKGALPALRPTSLRCAPRPRRGTWRPWSGIRPCAPWPCPTWSGPRTGRRSPRCRRMSSRRCRPAPSACPPAPSTRRRPRRRPKKSSEGRGRPRGGLGGGAMGLSTGTFSPPAAKATTEEIIEVARPLTAHKALYATHMRNEGDHVIESLEETFRIGRALDVPVVVSHHKVQYPQNFGRSSATLALIGQAMQHQCIGLDCYPYTAGSTMIRTDRSMMEGRVLIASSQPHPECAGRDLKDIAAEWVLSSQEAARRLQPGSAIYFMMDEGDVQRILAFDDTMIGSDRIPFGAKPHPRLWGTFPRVLGHYSRDIGLFPLG